MVSVGDRVGYSAHFLKSVAADYTTGSRRGTVTEVDVDRPFAWVQWDDGALNRAHTSNLARVGSVAFSDPAVKPRP